MFGVVIKQVSGVLNMYCGFEEDIPACRANFQNEGPFPVSMVAMEIARTETGSGSCTNNTLYWNSCPVPTRMSPSDQDTHRRLNSRHSTKSGVVVLYKVTGPGNLKIYKSVY